MLPALIHCGAQRCVLHVVVVRPYTAAVGHRVMGKVGRTHTDPPHTNKQTLTAATTTTTTRTHAHPPHQGTERIEHYDRTRIVFMNIDNIHAVRRCYVRIVTDAVPFPCHANEPFPMVSRIT